MTDCVGRDLGNLALAIAERAQRLGNGAVDDLEVAAAGQLLELHEREVRLDARRVAIHDEADGAGRRNHGRLRVAEAGVLAELDGAVPGAACGADEPLVGAVRVVERHGCDRQLLVAVRLPVCGAAVIADHAQHLVAVRLIAGERPEL